MIIVKVESDWNDQLKMSITHKEVFENTTLDDVLDVIQDVHSYIFSRCDNEIRFLIEDNWVESRVDGRNVYVFYHSKYNMIERICTSYEIRILDDDTIYLQCYFKDRMVVNLRLV